MGYQEKNLKNLFRELKSQKKLRHELNLDYVEKLILTITQRRQFFQHMTILSGAIIGFLSFREQLDFQNIFLRFGLILHAVFIILTLFYFREILDKEGNNLQKQQDNYNEILDERINLVEDYIENKKYENENMNIEFVNNMKNLKGTDAVDKENKDLDKKRQERQDKLYPLDFSSEFLVCIFVIASFFVLIYAFEINLKLIYIILSIILLIILSFTSLVTNFIKYLFWIPNYIRKTYNKFHSGKKLKE